MKRKRFTVLVLCLLMSVFVSSLIGCTNESAVGKDEKIVIGFSNNSDTPFLVILQEEVVKTCKEYGAECIVKSAANSSETQLSDIESMIVQNVDAIIMSPVDREACGVIVDAVKEAGIYLVEVNTFTNNEDYDVYVGSPEEEAGSLQAQWLLDNVGTNGSCAIIQGLLGASSTAGRQRGFIDTLGIDINSTDKDNWVVLDALTANWDRAEAKKLTEDWLQLYADQLDAIIAHDDEMAMGALSALEEAGLDDKIAVLGIDGMEESIQSIINGGQAMTALQDGIAQGRTSVDIAMKLINGEKTEKIINIPFKLVDKNNAKEFLE